MTDPHNHGSREQGHSSPGKSLLDLGNLAHAAAGIKSIVPLVALGLLIIGWLVAGALQQATLMGGSATFWLLFAGLVSVFVLLLFAIGREKKSAPPTLPTPSTVLAPATFSKIKISNERVFVFAIADVPDYAAAVSRLNALFAKHEFSVDSMTAIGVYGNHDIVIELICDGKRKKEIVAEIKGVLGPKKASSGLPDLIIREVIEVAKINNCLLGGVSATGKTFSVPLENGQFYTEEEVTIECEVFPVPSNNDLLVAVSVPYVVAYLFIEVRSTKDSTQQLKLVYSHLTEVIRHDNDVKGLFLLTSAVVLKNVFLTTEYYSYASFTKRIDAVIRKLGYSDLLEVRTLMGAEVLNWS